MTTIPIRSWIAILSQRTGGQVCKGTYSRCSGIKVYDLHGLQRLTEAVMNYDLRFLPGDRGKMGPFPDCCDRVEQLLQATESCVGG